MSPSLLERMSFRKDLNKVPAAACWDYAEIPLLVQARLSEDDEKSFAQDAVGRLWVFEVGERSEVGALESPPAAACWDYEEIIVRGNAEIRNPPLSGRAKRGRCPRIQITPLATRATNMSESE